MLKILQARLQQYMNWELPDVQAGFWRGRGTGDQMTDIRCIVEKAREFQKNIYFCFIDYAKAFDCVDYNKLWKILNKMGIPDHLTCSWKSCMQVRKQKLEPDVEQQTGSKLGKEYVKAVILSLCLFNLYAEYIVWNAGLDEMQAGIKTARRNINNLRYADDTTLMAEAKRNWRALMKVKEESEKAGLKLNIQEMKIMASGPISSWQIDGGTMETMTDYFLGLQNHCR